MTNHKESISSNLKKASMSYYFNVLLILVSLFLLLIMNKNLTLCFVFYYITLCLLGSTGPTNKKPQNGNKKRYGLYLRTIGLLLILSILTVYLMA